MKMKTHSAIAILFAVCLLAGGTSLLAHHSMAGFDANKQVTIEGTVTQVNWTNPHSLFYVEGKLAGATDAPAKKWVFEGPAPGGLLKQGWTKESLNVGDKITLIGNPSKGGSAFALLKEVITAAGKHLATGVAPNYGATRGGSEEY
jgi:hypothetical protein